MKKYEVFISSTYKDLRKERKIVKKALIDMGCFPAAMEQFPATDQRQFDYIKKIINECDYYIIIMGGHLGFIPSESTKSYTQMEYEYAKERNIPVIAFVKLDDTGEPVNFEKDIRANYYNDFLNDIQNERIRKGFRKKYELFGHVQSALQEEMKVHPQIGWIRNINPPVCTEEDLLLRGRLLYHFLIDKQIYRFNDEFEKIPALYHDLPKMVIKYGEDNQNRFKLNVLPENDTSGINFYDLIDERFFDENDILKDGCKMQVSIAVMGNIDEPLLFFSVGDTVADMDTIVFRIDKVGIVEIARISGQRFMYIDYSLDVHYGFQGLFDSYVYLNGEICRTTPYSDDNMN